MARTGRPPATDDTRPPMRPISRAVIAQAVRDLGYDPNRVLEVRVTASAVTVTVAPIRRQDKPATVVHPISRLRWARR